VSRSVSPGPVIGDVVAVLVFAAIGRASHEEGLSLLGVLETAWPFLTGLLVGWAIVNAVQWPGEMVWPAGVAIWGSVLAVGLLLRGLTGAGLSMPFPIIAGISLAVVLLIPRLISTFVSRRHDAPKTAAE
jgi:hypothetical protein